MNSVHGLLPEQGVAADAGQRWHAGRHSFVRTRDGGFDPDRYEVVAFPNDARAKTFVEEHHYSKAYPAAKARYGLLLRDPAGEDPLVGVAVFSVPANTRVITSVFPDLDLSTGVELGRLVLEGPPAGQGGPQRAPANAESWFVARCLEDLAGRGIRGVVSFSDPVPRRALDGTVTLPGHAGLVYQALNMRYTGRGTARYVTLLPDGRTISDRALQKVRAQECGHEYVERRLVDLGAVAPRAFEDPAAWLTDALNDIQARRFKHAGNHRYVIPVGQTRADRRAVRIALPGGDYPKTPDRASAAA